jgi:cell division transport system ATP-binding protein
MVILEDVFKAYRNGVNALNGLSMTIDDGEFVYVIGNTGSGKSTLVKLLDGEEIPTKGTVMVNSINVGRLRFSKVPLYRRNIGVVFQDYRLLEYKTVFENVAYSLEVIGLSNLGIHRRVREVLDIVDLQDKARSFPREISGGQQQRVAIARAIANKPKVVLADEPTGNLDPAKSNDIVELLEKINKTGTTIIMVTHDNNLVEHYRHRTIKLQDGRIIADRREGGYIPDVQSHRS